MIIAYLNCSGEELDQCVHLTRDKVDAQAGFAFQTDSYPLLPGKLLLTSGTITKKISRKKKNRANGAGNCQVNNFSCSLGSEASLSKV